MLRALAPTSLALPLMLATLNGCHSCAGIADLEVGAGGGGGSASTSTTTAASPTTGTGDGGGTGATTTGATTTGATTTGDPSSSVTSTGTDATTTTGSSTTSSSTSSGGVECGGDNCEFPDEFCEVHEQPGGGGATEACKACGEFPPPPQDLPQCPPFCTNACADDTCDVQCAESSHCDPSEVFLDPRVTDMTMRCDETETCFSKVVTCLGPQGDEGPGRHDCHVICEGAGACASLHLDCTDHSGRCIVECHGGSCFNTSVTCGANECIVCGEDFAQVTIEQSGTCRLTTSSNCIAI